MYGDPTEEHSKKKFKIPEEYIISHKNPVKMRWDVLILILSIMNSLVIPLD